MSAALLAACGAPAAAPTATTAPTTAPTTGTEDVARPSNPGGPGTAVTLKGDAPAVADVYVAN